MAQIQEVSGNPATAMLECLSGLTTQALPPQALERASLALLDTIGCGLNGSGQIWGRIVRDTVRDDASRGFATVFGDTIAVGAAQAALANGTMIHGFELDDVILGSLVHAGTVVVPAVLAIAETVDAPSERVMLGLVAGYEAIARLGAALGEHCAGQGFHPTGVAGAVAAAIAACVVLQTPLPTMVDAVGIACSCGAGIKAFTQGTGGMVKRLHGGRAAEAGVRAAQLAMRGFTGPHGAIDGRFGLIEVFGGHDTAPLTRDLGGDWAVQRTWTKVWPCCGVLHTAVQALETIVATARIDAQAVTGVTIGTSRRAVEQNGDRTPREAMAAQYSLPFCAALALGGDARDPAAYADDRLADPRVTSLLPRVSLHVDQDIDTAYPDKFAARVELTTEGGGAYSETVWDAHGMPNDPCTRDEVEAKFHRLAGTACGPVAADILQRKVAAFAAGRSSARDLGRALRAAAVCA